VEVIAMKKNLFTLLFLGFALSQIWADEKLYNYGTVFGGGGAVSSFLVGHFGAGGGVVYKSGFGLNAEGGYMVAFGNYAEGVLLADINANYHFLNATSSKQLIPFLTGGYSWFCPDGHKFNFGGGIDYWVKPKTGIRFEFRDHPLGESNVFGVRAAFIFRN
jgi:hypothetical protein